MAWDCCLYSMKRDVRCLWKSKLGWILDMAPPFDRSILHDRRFAGTFCSPFTWLYGLNGTGRS
ncbi:hypothetical protein AG1IA_04339 [Rhizoctonia solani AG-1 IA]|uniref:Uncharacterized protein n=1 Tax=Thanatephorus cucumeris (strain AG1-IA) TaxID=983506 RepID=L8WTZ9_THACA|nr:hypothetical protein AG1IA_04339 [Rhizoctonia solani AG-1 IA]